MRTVFFCLLICCCGLRATAQMPSQTIIGKTDTLYSSLLKQQRQLLIYLPPDYSPEKRYPVCYLLDGESHFHLFTAMVRHLANYAIPEMIVVGIVNINRGRDYPPTYDASFPDTANGKGEVFAAFMAQELIPYVEHHYATLPYRLLAGHSLGGLFVINMLLHHSAPFKAYIALDPSLWWDGMKLVNQAPALLSGKAWPNTTLFLGLSGQFPTDAGKVREAMKDTTVRTSDVRSVLRFKEYLAHSAGNGLRWSSKHYADEIHGSVPLPGYYDGLRFVFDFYRRPPMNILTDSTVDILERHYQRVSQEMGYEMLPPEADLGGLAWRSTVLEHNPDRAYRYLQTYVRLYPGSAEAQERMGDYFSAKDDTARARTYYQQAKALSATSP